MGGWATRPGSMPAIRESWPEDTMSLGPHAWLPHFRTDAVPALVVALGIAPAPIAGGAREGGRDAAREAAGPPDDPARRRTPQGACGVPPDGCRLRPGALTARAGRRAGCREVRRRGARPAGAPRGRARRPAPRPGPDARDRHHRSGPTTRSTRPPAAWKRTRSRRSRSWATPARWWASCRTASCSRRSRRAPSSG